MKLTEADLLEFKAIRKEELGLELSDAEVAEEARQLINLVKLVYSHPRAAPGNPEYVQRVLADLKEQHALQETDLAKMTGVREKALLWGKSNFESDLASFGRLEGFRVLKKAFAEMGVLSEEEFIEGIGARETAEKQLAVIQKGRGTEAAERAVEIFTENGIFKPEDHDTLLEALRKEYHQVTSIACQPIL